ncbi:hypothetical protein CEXT_20121 [Caerostris extrusa]|uniref:Uncharacterized protein n=1 Tax=Caerostris extrusa TaxID=172846 RepID=A0AAV4PVD8_CAEEX|nr:hypothetical protein CEXT_20121 [Caerostris extrusa]
MSKTDPLSKFNELFEFPKLSLNLKTPQITISIPKELNGDVDSTHNYNKERLNSITNEISSSGKQGLVSDVEDNFNIKKCFISDKLLEKDVDDANLNEEISTIFKSESNEMGSLKSHSLVSPVFSNTTLKGFKEPIYCRKFSELKSEANVRLNMKNKLEKDDTKKNEFACTYIRKY